MVGADSKPNWAVWAHVPKVEIWEAVALSLDIEPKTVWQPSSDAMGIPTPFTYNEEPEFTNRLEVLVRNAEHFVGPVYSDASTVHVGIPIVAFVRFAMDRAWQIPGQLKKLAAQDRTPNWSVWANVPHVAAWEAVALSLDLDPKHVRVSKDGWMAGPGHFIHEGGQPFADRLEVLTRNLTTLKLHSVIQGRPHHCEIYVAEFAHFAQTKGWGIPGRLAALAVPLAPKSQPAKVKDDLSTSERNSLLKLVIGMAVRGYKYAPGASRSDVVPEIAKDLEEAGVRLEADTVRKYLKEAALLLPKAKT